MQHLVYNQADVEILQQVQALQPLLAGDIHIMQSNYALGPIEHLHTTQGQVKRQQYFKNINNEITAPASSVVIINEDNDDDETKRNLVPYEPGSDVVLIQTLQKLLQQNPEEKLYLWCAQNAQDVSGYYHTISQLQAYQGQVYILYLNNLPFINTKGQLYYPTHITHISPTELLKTQYLARAVTPSEFELDKEEWQKLGEANFEIRLLDGGKKLTQHPENYYDELLKSCITLTFQKVQKIITQAQVKNVQKPTDEFLHYRLLQLTANAELYTTKGNKYKAKEYEVHSIIQEKQTN